MYKVGWGGGVRAGGGGVGELMLVWVWWSFYGVDLVWGFASRIESGLHDGKSLSNHNRAQTVGRRKNLAKIALILQCRSIFLSLHQLVIPA